MARAAEKSRSVMALASTTNQWTGVGARVDEVAHVVDEAGSSWRKIGPHRNDRR